MLANTETVSKQKSVLLYLLAIGAALLLLACSATVAEAQSIVLKSTSDTGSSQTDNRTHDYTPTVTLSGFTGTINLTATASSETNVTASRSGDGDVTIPRLTPGKQWTISATDGTNTATLAVHIDNLLVGNRGISASTSGSTATGHTHAQSFTTDSDSYALEEIQYTSSGRFTISVQGVAGSGHPDGNKLATIVGPATGGGKTVTLDTPLILAASTSYFIVFEGEGSPSLGYWSGTGRNNEDPSATGWTIADNRHSKNGNDPWGGPYTDRIWAINLRGSLVPTQTVALATASDTGSSQTDNITSDDTPDIVVAGFGTSDHVTVVATKVGTSTTVRSTEAQGNTTHTLPTLSDGLWHIIAQNRLGDRTLRIAVTIDTTPPTVSVPDTQFTGHLSDTDLYINLADTTAATQNLITALTTDSITYQYAVIASSTDCDSGVTFTNSVPQTNNIPSTDGTYRVCVRAEDANDRAGNIGYGTSSIFTRDATIPIISAVSEIGTVTDTTPDLSFTASEAGTLVVNSACGITASAVTANTNTITLTELGMSTYGSCTIQMTDTAGNPSVAVNIPSFTINPSISIAALSTDPATTREATATVNGLSPAGLNWVLFDPSDGAPTCADTTTSLDFSGAGAYTSGDAVTIAQSESDNGKKACFRATVSGTTYYQASDVIAGVDTTAPTAVLNLQTKKGSADAEDLPGTDVFLKVGDTINFNDASTDTGGGINTAERQIVVTLGTQAQHTGNTASGISPSATTGGWEYVIEAGKNGIIKYTFTAMDRAGNTDNLTNTITNLFLETIAPATPTIDLNTADDTGVNNDNITSDNTPGFTITNDTARRKSSGGATINNETGHSAEGIEWHLTDADGSTFTKQSTTTSTFTPGTALTEGVYKIKAAFIDAAGNKTESAVLTFTIDTTAPAAPTALDLAAADDTGLNTDNITKNTEDLTITVTATGENGGTVQLYRTASPNDVAIGSATAITANTASIDIDLTAGTHSIYAKTTDKAGNVSPASTPLSITVDTTAPTVSVPAAQFTGHLSATDLYINKADDDDNTPEDLITALSTNGVTYKYAVITSSTDCDEDVTLTTGVPQTDDIPSTDGTYKVCVEGTDTAGNAGYGASPTFTKDTTTPAAPTALDLDAGDDTGSSATDNITKQTTNLTFEATATGEDGGTVEFFRAGSTSLGSDTIATGEASIDSTLTAGTHTITAKTTDQAGNESPASTPLQITVDTTPPAKPTTPDLAAGSDTGASDSDNITKDTTPTITTTAVADATYEWTIDGAVNNSFTTNTVAITTALSQGDHTFSVKVTDLAGNQSAASDDLTITIDTTAPTLSSPSSIGSTANTSPDLSFTATEGGTITVGGGCATTTTSVSAASGTKTIVLGPLTPGTYASCTVTVTDAAGNASNALAITSFSIVSGSISIVMLSTPARTREATATVSGTSSNRNWVLFDPSSGTPTCAGTTSNLDFSSAGTYTSGTAVTVSSAEADNGKKVCFRATISSVIFYQASNAIAGIDRTNPAAPTNLDLATADDTGSNTGDNITKNTSNLTIAVTATGENGGTVQLYRTASPNDVTIGSATTIAANTASIDIALTAGTHSIYAKTTDQAGNVSPASTALQITVDTTPPAKPTTPDLAAGSDTGASDSDNITSDTTPTITTTAVADATYEWTIDGAVNNSFTTNTVAITTALTTGDHTFSVKVSDRAGNQSAASDDLTITIDTTAPAKPTGLDLDEADDTGVNTDNITKNTEDLTIEVTAGVAENGGTIQLYRGSSTIGSATTIAGGKASIDIDLTVGTHAITAKTTDKAGNVSPASDPLSITVDTTVPAAPTNLDLDAADDTGSSQTDNVTSQTTGLTFTVTTSGTDAQTVQFYNGSATLGSPATISANSATITTSLAAGTHTITAKTIDLASNSSSASSAITVIVDTSAPNETITNSVFANALSASDNYINAAEETADAAIITAPTGSDSGGAYSFTYKIVGGTATCSSSVTHASTIPTADFTGSDGTYKVCIKVVDVAGNTQYTATPTFIKDTTVPAAPTGLDLDANDDTGSSNTDNITKNTEDLTIEATATGENGGTVQFYNGSNTIGSAVTISLNKASIDIDLTAGTRSITAKTTDQAGNVSPASSPLSIIVDTSPPTAPTAPGMTTATDLGPLNSDKITSNATPDLTFTPTDGTNDLGKYKVHIVANSTTTNATCPAKTVSTDTLVALADNSEVTHTPSSNLSEGKYCVYVEQADIAGNRVVSSPSTIYIDLTAPVVTGVTINLADASDSTRQEVTADSETDNDDVWNPGKIDDYTKEASVSIEVAGVPIDTIMGARRATGIVLKGGVRDASHAFNTPPTNTRSHAFNNYALTTETGANTFLGKANSIVLEVQDIAGNRTTTTATVITVDTETKEPNTPDLAAATDTGSSSTDNYTNAEHLTIVVEDDDDDTHREQPTITRLYTWTDAGDTDGVVQAGELTVLQKESTPSDQTVDSVAIDWLIKGSNAGKDVSFEHIILAQGTHKIVAGQIDKAGNDEVYSAPLTIYVDRTPPAAPTAPTLNSADDSGAERPGAEKAENNVYRTDGVTNINTDLSFFGCADPSDIRTTGATDAAIVTAVTRDGDDAIVTDTGTTNEGTSGRAVQFGDTLTAAGGSVIRPTSCPDGLFPYKLDLDETYGTANRNTTYTVKMKATDLAGNTSAEGAATTIVIDRLKPTDPSGGIFLDALTDNGNSDSDNATSLTDLLYTTNKNSIDNNTASAYKDRTYGSLSHYEIALQLYRNGATVGAIFPAPSTEQVTYFQGTTIPEQTINGSQTLPARTLGDSGIAVLVKGLNLEFDQYSNAYQTRIRAVDVAGNVQELSPVLSATYLLPPPPITSVDLATASDSASGVAGTDTDNMTNIATWKINGSFTYRERDNSAVINTVKARVIDTGTGTAIATADITNISHGRQGGSCWDESSDCSETDDTDSTFTHTFDFSEQNLADGVYRVELQTYDGSDVGATNSGDTALVITYDTTPPSTDGLLESMTAYIAIRNSALTRFDIKATKPQKGDFNVYAVGGTTTLATDVRDKERLVGPFVRLTGAALRPNFDYEFSITDAVGNESERVALPQAPNISIVRLGDSTPVQYAAVAFSHADATDFLEEDGNTLNFGHYTTQTALTADCEYGTDGYYNLYTAGSAVELSGGDTRVCFRYGHILEGVAIEIVKDTQGAPDFASLSLHADDDTTISTYTTNKNAFTSTQRPRINGSSLPETPVRIYRVTDAQFTAATTGSEWSELAVDANKVFDGTSHSTDGSFSVPAPSQALAEGVYHIAARISLDSGGTYTDAAQVFTLTIDTTAPGKQPNAPTIKLPATDTGSSNSDGVTSVAALTIQQATALATGEELFTCYKDGEKVSEHYQARECNIDFPEDGTYSITTTVTDNAGNESPHSDPLSVTIDTTDPDITIIRLFDTDTTIDLHTRFIAVAGDLTTTTFSTLRATKATCASLTSGGTAYTEGSQFDPDETAGDIANGICFIVKDLAGNVETLHTDDAIEGVGSFTIEGGTEEGATVYTTSGAKTITGVSAPEAKVLIKIADATDDPSTYTTTQLRNTSFATTSFDMPTGQTTFERTLSISAGDNGKKVVGWIWTDATDQTTATPAITLTTLTVDNTKPVVTPGTITSDNTNPAFAKQGNTITATFTTSEAIKTHTTMVNGITATCTDTNNSFSCTASLTNTATEGVATVTTTVTDKAGNTTTHTFRNQNITVDATAPEVAITNLSSQHFKGTGEQSFTLTITDTNQISPGTYTFTATGGTLATCQIIVPATSNQETATCTITTASGTNGTPITLAIPLLADASGNTKTAHSQILGYIDTAAPTIDSIDTLDDTEKKKLTLTLTATHNQHASNTSEETLTPVFSGDCSKFDARANWKGTTTHQYTATFSVPKGTYKTCTLALRDEAGNSSATQTLAEFSIKGGGGIASIGGAISRGIASVSDIFSGGGSDSTPAQSSQPENSVLSSIEAFGDIFSGSDNQAVGDQFELLEEVAASIEVEGFVRDLTIGSVGEDVRSLQRLLNSLGFTISDTGAGSPGEESTYFGEKTRQALIRYQQANGITPASGYFGPITRAYIKREQGQGESNQTTPVAPTTSAEEVQETVSFTDAEEQQTSTEEVAASIETEGLTRDLTIGSVGEDVRSLQKLLNSLGYIVSETGPGSPGEESTYFGEKTRQALIRYQQANGIEPASGYFGPITRAYIQGQQGSSTPAPTEGIEEVRAEVQQVEPQSEQEQVQEPQAQTEPAPQQIEEVQSFVETVDDAEEYEPITDILYRVRQPSFGAPQF